MKTKIFAALSIVLFAVNVVGQCTINFANLVVVDGVRVLDAPVSYFDGTLVSGSGFMAQLYAGLGSGDSLSPVGQPTPFLTGVDVGYFSGGTRTIGWVQPGKTVSTVEIHVWEVASGLTWETATRRTASNGLTIQTGGLNGAPPANLIGLQPFSFIPIPEPSTLALWFLGAVVLGAQLRRR